MNELKPCPFCDGNPSEKTEIFGDVTFVYVECSSCYARIDSYQCPKDAYNNWNNRPNISEKNIALKRIYILSEGKFNTGHPSSIRGVFSSFNLAEKVQNCFNYIGLEITEFKVIE